MNLTLAARAEKIREDIQSLPAATIQQNNQFFTDVWIFCGAVIGASQGDNGQFILTDSIM